MDPSFIGPFKRPRLTPSQIRRTDIANIAKTVMGEAEDQGPVGMEAVGRVIRNRYDQGRGRSFTEVINDPKQFTIWNNKLKDRAQAIGRMRPGQGNPQFDEAYEVAKRVYYDTVPYVHDEVGDVAMDADLYYNPKKASPKWAKHKKVPYLGTIGDHNFHRDYNRTPKPGTISGTLRYRGGK